jgi:glycosyltransferase involved in cell wall biosynthesis
MKKLKVLQVLPALNTGGVEDGTVAVAEALAQAGHSSFIASAGGHKVHQAISLGAKHFTLPLNKKSPLLFFKMISELANIIRRENIDIIHARSRWPAWCAYFAAKRCGIPYMTTFHGAHKSNNVFKSLYNSIMVRARHTIAVSHFMNDHIRNTYSKTLQLYDTTLHVIPRGIDPIRFDPDRISDEEAEALRKSWNIPDNTPVIILPARMTRMKGHEVFVEALCQLKHKDWFAVIVGGQPERMVYQRELEEKLKVLGLNDQVKIVPAMENIPAAYKLADIVIYPTTQPEAFGRVIIEAQAMGKPIITSNLGEPATIVKHGVTGWQFECGNVRDLAAVMDEVLSLSKEQLNAYALTARQSVLDNYTKELMCKHTLEVYEQVNSKAE